MSSLTVAQPTDLRISLADIARLAQVKRPVVSMWRRRFANGDQSFPPALAKEGGIEYFDALQVARWLEGTQHGNNSDAAAEVALYARPALVPSDERWPSRVLALLALRAVHGSSVASLGFDDLLDLADEVDPDDECLYREVEALGENARRTAAYIDELVDAAFGAPNAFEHFMAVSNRSAASEAARLVLTDDAAAIVSEVAIELALTNSDADPAAPRFIDPTGSCADRMVDIAVRLTDLAEPLIVTADHETEAARMLRRRLLAHGVPRGALAVRDDGDFEFEGAATHVAHYPTSDGHAADPVSILSAVDQIAVQMDDAQRAVVLAPARVLVDGGLDAEASALRSSLLRTGRVRAIVRLPDSLLVAAPRQHLALWVLGTAHESVPIAERWTMLADLSERRLTDAVRADLVGDLAASMGDRAAVSAHPFTFTRLTRTSRVLARTGSLLDMGAGVRHAPDAAPADAAISARLDGLLAELGEAAPATAQLARPATAPTRLAPTPLGELIRERHVRYLPGTRLLDDDVASQAEAGFTVIGPDEVTGARAPGSRTIDRLLLAMRYPSARLTEPGDVVFVTSPRPAAWVDRDGSSVVAAPGRVLRVNAADHAGVLSDVLAADISRRPSDSRAWRTWSVRRVAIDEREPVARALTDLRGKRAAARNQIERLDRLESLIVAGVTAGTLTLTEPPVD